MGFYNTYRIGLLEKAGAIAIKHGVIYRSKLGIFEGEKADKAARELEDWQAKERMRARRD